MTEEDVKRIVKDKNGNKISGTPALNIVIAASSPDKETSQAANKAVDLFLKGVITKGELFLSCQDLLVRKDKNERASTPNDLKESEVNLDTTRLTLEKHREGGTWALVLDGEIHLTVDTVLMDDYPNLKKFILQFDRSES